MYAVTVQDSVHVRRRKKIGIREPSFVFLGSGRQGSVVKLNATTSTSRCSKIDFPALTTAEQNPTSVPL